MKSKRAIPSSTISLSDFNLSSFLFSLKDSLSGGMNNFRNSGSGLSNMNQSDLKKTFKRFLPSILLLVIVVGVILGVKTVLQRAFSGGSLAARGVNDSRVDIKDAKAKVNINREFSFPIKDDKGKEIARLKYALTSAELRDEIIVKGQKATSVKGRTYLILTIDLTNSGNKAISFNTLNYVRLSMNGNRNKWIAADIHNDPVLIQAISTKTTRLGFPVNDSDKDLVLQVGEVDGSKQTVALKF